jgi:signal transduction histidine kinase
VCIESELDPAPISGDELLLERLLANLLQNAVGHNLSGGWVRVETDAMAGRSRLRVSNSGPIVVADEVGGLLEPFRRAGSERAGHRDGHGLGLSIVAGIASAHGAVLQTRAREQGGLEIEVSFRAAPQSAERSSTPRAGHTKRPA